MKTLVVYDSQFGNTERIARAVADAILGEVELRRATETDAAYVAGFDFVVVGSPTQGGRPTAAVKKFLDGLQPQALKGIEVAAFDTRIDVEGQFFALKLLMKMIGFAASRIAAGLQAKDGHLLSDPQGFIVDGKEGPLRQGELQRATRWACQLAKPGTHAVAP